MKSLRNDKNMKNPYDRKNTKKKKRRSHQDLL